MKPDYAKATAELLQRLRREASLGLPPNPPSALSGIPPNVVIHAPRDCVFYITPALPPEKPRES